MKEKGRSSDWNGVPFLIGGKLASSDHFRIARKIFKAENAGFVLTVELLPKSFLHNLKYGASTCVQAAVKEHAIRKNRKKSCLR